MTLRATHPPMVFAPPRAGNWPAVKRLLDAVGGVLLLLLSLPVLLVAVLLIRIESRGPALFRQERCGLGGRPFTVFKLRSMRIDASEDVHRAYIAELASGRAADGDGLKKLTKDPRVTRVGRVLRKTSVDELPQLINVVLGQMSLVGPRPALAYELEFYEPRHLERFTVRPGLTGLWQVSGRAALGFGEMLDLDVAYARSSSPGMDAAILARTPRALLRSRTA